MNAQTSIVAAAERPRRRLTPGQLTAVRLSALGYSAAETGQAMASTAKAAEALLHGAREKLGARNAAHLAALAVAEGIVTPELLLEGRAVAERLGLLGCR
jgi:DNA-binding CsgD family transcriptional regulator